MLAISPNRYHFEVGNKKFLLCLCDYDNQGRPGMRLIFPTGETIESPIDQFTSEHQLKAQILAWIRDYLNEDLFNRGIEIQANKADGNL